MNIFKISPELQIKLEQVLANYPLVLIIAQTIADHGGRTLLVGGAVRDLMLGLPVKDLDIEVHGITLEQLEKILRTHGAVDLVGKSFGVLRLGILDVDWALPRSDSSGRKPHVTIDSTMAFDRAFARRDLTINAMGIDLISHELIDPFNGAQDLRNRVLRAPDPQLFLEDPLRFFRVMQFIARFEMYPDQKLTQVCQQMDISAVSRERIEVEFEKIFLKSARPSLGLRWLHDIGRLHEVLPEVAALVGVKQSPVWHPEGDVFEHTMQAVDAGAQFNYQDPKQKLLLLYAVLCHDLGKAVATQINGDAITSYNHEVVGVPIAKKLLKRITNNTQIIDDVCKLVRYHMAPVAFV